MCKERVLHFKVQVNSVYFVSYRSYILELNNAV